MLRKVFSSFFVIRKSIQAKIFVTFILITLAALAVVTYIWYVNSSNTIKYNATRYIADSIQRANRNLEITLKDIDNITIVAAINQMNVMNILRNKNDNVSFEWFEEFKKIKDFLTTLSLFKQKTITGIAIIGLDGTVYKAGNPYVSASMLKQPWSKKILEAQGKSVFVKRSIINDESNLFSETTQIMTIGRAIMKSGHPIAIVAIDMEYDIIKKTFDMNFLADSYIFVVDQEGNFIYHSDPLVKNSNIENTSYWHIYKQVHNGQTHMISKMNGKEYLIVNYRSEYTGWTTVGMIQKTILEKDFIETRNQIISIVILIFIIVLIVSMIISNQITKNLKKLRDAMILIEKGNLMATPRIVSQDEVGELSEGFTRMMAKIHNLLENIKTQEKLKRATELKALQAQISPHFLYNTLNTIKYLAELQNVRNINEVTTSLIDLLRITIGKGEQFITIEKEIEHVKNYLNIQKYKYTDKFSIIYQIEDEVLTYKTVKMILQPILENSLIHGIEPLDAEGVILIKIYREGNIIVFRVTDNGVGMTEQQINQAFLCELNSDKPRFSGIGIGNVDERIKLFFGNEYGLKIISQPGMYTTVEISIPAIEGKENDAESAYCG